MSEIVPSSQRNFLILPRTPSGGPPPQIRGTLLPPLALPRYQPFERWAKSTANACLMAKMAAKSLLLHFPQVFVEYCLDFADRPGCRPHGHVRFERPWLPGLATTEILEPMMKFCNETSTARYTALQKHHMRPNCRHNMFGISARFFLNVELLFKGP